MESSFECPVCFEQYNPSSKPLLIPCGHTACSNCLLSLLKNKQLECPVCRTLHHNLSISSLSTNFALMQSSTSKPAQTVLDRLEDLHKQQSSFQSFKSSFQESFEKSLSSLSKCKNEVVQKRELIFTLATTLSQNLLMQIESLETQTKAKYEKLCNQLEGLISQRTELISSLEAFYSKNEEIPATLKLQLASLTVPKLECDLERYSTKSSPFDFNEKIVSWFGTIDLESSFKSELNQSNLVQSKMLNAIRALEIDKKVEAGSGRGAPFRGADNSRGRGRGRGEIREEQKQPRQHRIEANCWAIQTQYGKWEKLPPWFDAQLKAAKERGEETVMISNGGAPEYFVNFSEMKSYQIGLKGNHIRGKKIAFDIQ